VIYYWRHFKDILQHKMLVFQECQRLGLPLWVGILHDLSKFLPSEFVPYMDYLERMGEFPHDKDMPMVTWLGKNPKTKESVKVAFAMACQLHYRRNKHHWNSYVKDGIADPMPELYRLEMLADWWAVARALGNESPLAWYTMMKQEGRIVLHPETEAWIEKELGYGNS
jgi:hypothetical protein